MTAHRQAASLTAALLAIALLGPARPAQAQEPIPDTTTALADTTDTPADSAQMRDPAEAALDDLDPGAGNAEQLAELLRDLADTPLDINTATAAEFATIPSISLVVAQRIARFRRQYGPYGSLPELRAVEGVSRKVFTRARPYLTIGRSLQTATESQARFPSPPSFGQVLNGLEFSVIQRLTRRLDVGEGYHKPDARSITEEGDSTYTRPYRGTPERLYTRIRARYERHVSLNLTLDKDPGESFRWDPGSQTYGYDHVSGHAALSDFGRLKTLVVGDFAVEYGQGLTLWRSFSFGKGRSPVGPVARSGRGIVPYGSTEENRFFRGVAGTVMLTPALSASAFLSRRTLDATVVAPDTALTDVGSDLDQGAAQATTLSVSGYHRTAGELERKDALGETLYGANLEYIFDQARIGAVGYHTRFDNPIAPSVGRLYQRFDFSGQEATMASLYANVFLGDFLLFGEGARAPGGALGGLGGVLADFSPSAEAVLLARHFPRDFAGLHGYAFGERSGATQNETGFYGGLRLQPHEDWTVSGYFDQYHFPWVRFAVPRPSTGYDTRLVVEHQPRPWLSYYVQARSETRETGATVNDMRRRPLEGLQKETRQSARLNLDYQFSSRLTLRSRLETARYVEGDRDDEYGLILYQDMRWNPFETLQLDTRLAFFDTDSYNARVYAYENDLLYTFSIPTFFGQGQRAYLLARYAPTEDLDLELKYAVTRFQDAETVGSGLNEVNGPRVREVRAQVRWRF